VARSDRRSQHITIAKPWAYATGRQFEAGVWFSFRSARPAALLVAELKTRFPVIVVPWLRMRQWRSSPNTASRTMLLEVRSSSRHSEARH
jgi:hypothetical protein